MSNPQQYYSAAESERIRIRALAEIERRKREGTWEGVVQPHIEYQKRPLDWIHEKLGVPLHTMRWSLNPEYQSCHCPRCVALGNEGRPHLWDGTPDPIAQALEEVSLGNDVAMPSGTGTGKSWGLGGCGALWWLACFPRSIFMSIAPKQEQLLVNLWKAIGDLFPRFKRMFPSAVLLTGKLRMLEGEGEQEVWAATAFGAGKDADEEVSQRLKGSHWPCMWWFIEEGPGMPQAHINTIVNTAVGSFNPITIVGQPEHQYDTMAQFGLRAGVRTIRNSGLDHPNVVCGRDVIPGAVSAKSVVKRLEDVNGNVDDPIYLSQVRGVAPAQAKNALFRKHWLDEAAKRADDPAYRVGGRALGLDLADSENGDLAAVSRWWGAYAEVEASRCHDASEFGDQIAEECLEQKINGHHVGMDSAGIGGPVHKRMRRRVKGLRALNGGANPLPMLDQDILWSTADLTDDGRLSPGGQRVVTTERFDNLRSQMYWLLAEDFRLGRIALKYNKQLWEELLAITREHEAGMIWIVEKKITKKVLRRSPDRADALAYGNFVRGRSWGIQRGEKVAEPIIEKNRDYGLERHLARAHKRAKAEETRINRLFAQRAKARRGAAK